MSIPENDPVVNFSTAMPSAIIIAARRSPIGRVGGSLKALPVEALMAPVLRSLLADTGLAADRVDEVILGNAIGPGGNPARVALLEAKFPVSVPGLTVDRQCGSGLAAINQAARLIQSGSADIVIAGGVESCSTAPWRLEKPASLYQLPQFSHRARFAPDALGDPDMGRAAETIAQHYSISRDRQDAYALHSHQKAIAAIQSGRFHSELCPIPISSVTVIDHDECPRESLTLKRLARLPPAFEPGGTVTVGNACPINDGAAAVLMVSSRLISTLPLPANLRHGLRFVDAIATGVDPTMPGMGPVAAITRLLQRHPSLSLDDIDWVEFNEAFAAQVLACLDALAIPVEKVNPGGGAIALGHPYGASGAILVTRLFTDMLQKPQLSGTQPPQLGQPSAGRALGLATLGIGGGLGIATLFESIDLRVNFQPMDRQA
ncbi:MAG: thiolase family protein [Elainellaceae cyanobacterium]